MFYAIEGADNVGKTSLLSDVSELLRQAGREVVLTHEPYKINYVDINSFYLEKLMAIGYDRAQHVQYIKDLISQDPRQIIITDRYTMSTEVYQPILDRAPIKMLGLFTTEFEKLLYPLRWFVLYVSMDELPKRYNSEEMPYDLTVYNSLNEMYKSMKRRKTRVEILRNDDTLDKMFNALRVADTILRIEDNMIRASEVSRKYSPYQFYRHLSKEGIQALHPALRRSPKAQEIVSSFDDVAYASIATWVKMM